MFAGFDHIDVRVPDVHAVEPFYDKLMPLLGLTSKYYSHVDDNGDSVLVEDRDAANAIEYYEPQAQAQPRHFIGFITDPSMTPTKTRIAFRLPPETTWQEMQSTLERIGACNIEVSDDFEAYPAVFFEDPLGTRLEICRRTHSLT